MAAGRRADWASARSSCRDCQGRCLKGKSMRKLARVILITGAFLSGATAGTLVEGAPAPKTSGPFETEINLAPKEGVTLGFTNADKTRGSITVACVPSESAAFRDAKRGGIY